VLVSRPAVAGQRPNPIDAPGSSEAAWSRWPGLARCPVLDVGSWGSAVILAAHPDDEVLGAGGIVGLLAAARARLRLIAVTDGEASHPGGAAPGGTLARRRARERADALLALGAADAEVIRLGLPDTGLARREDEIASAVASLTAGFGACLAPWERDVHADHESVGRAARRAGSPAYHYPVWMWHWARPGDPRVPWRRALRVPLTPVVAGRKAAAIGCFTSQLEPRGPGAGPVLAPGFVSHFTRDYEVLFPVVRP
jgi:LmbE family N-acetylglucosaminyl deacetylase